MRAESTSLVLLTTTLAVCFVSGCATGRSTEILESRLRVQQDKLIEAERQLADATKQVQSLRDDLVAVRQSAAQRGEALNYGPRPASLAFSSLLTGGIDEDGQPGDEAIRAIIQPLTEDGTAIPAEGRLEVELLDVSAPADRRVRGSWTLAGQELRDQWETGLFSTGFELNLAPDSGPLPDGALLIARFITPEGEQLEATHTVKLRPDLDAIAASRSGVQQVSAVAQGMSDAELSRDLPDVLPVREPPKQQPDASEDSSNPFADFVSNATRTSDAWTDATIPVLR